MKRISAILISLLFTIVAIAQAPETMSYQAVIRNSNNQLVVGTEITLKISILLTIDAITPIYTETQKTTTNANGLISVKIGSIVPLSGIDWSDGPYFIRTEVDIAGGSNFTISGTSELLSVPFAFHSKTAESLTGSITEIDPVFSESQAANITEDDISNLSNLSGTNTGDQDGSETKLTAGDNISITGTGTTGNPYFVSAGGGSSHYVGELFGGGIVFWVDNTGNHGLICSLVDVAITEWSNIYSNLQGTTPFSEWDGLANSEIIILEPGHSYSAAMYCLGYGNDDYGTGFYDDWYLPSCGELYDIWHSYRIIQKVLENDGNATTYGLYARNYWSSTVIDKYTARSFSFATGSASESHESNNFYVRAVRTF